MTEANVPNFANQVMELIDHDFERGEILALENLGANHDADVAQANALYEGSAEEARVALHELAEVQQQLKTERDVLRIKRAVVNDVCDNASKYKQERDAAQEQLKDQVKATVVEATRVDALETELDELREKHDAWSELFADTTFDEDGKPPLQTVMAALEAEQNKVAELRDQFERLELKYAQLHIQWQRVTAKCDAAREQVAELVAAAIRWIKRREPHYAIKPLEDVIAKVKSVATTETGIQALDAGDSMTLEQLAQEAQDEHQ